MIDGRPLYTPLFSGVIWDAVDVPLEDIERIEVVRGPGAVMWGPNAVNGVINIISRRAQATKGGQARVATGNEMRGGLSAVGAEPPGDRVAYRVWGKLEYQTPAYHSERTLLFPGNTRIRSPGSMIWISPRAVWDFVSTASPTRKTGGCCRGIV